MVTLFAWLVIGLPLYAMGAEFVVPTEPSRVEMQRIKWYRVAYGFHQDESGDFSVLVRVIYRHTPNRIKRAKNLTFRLQRGTIRQRDANTLVLRLDNREHVVGKHRWWYVPYWQRSKNVSVRCDHARRLARVVIENCRIIIPSRESAGTDQDGNR